MRAIQSDVSRAGCRPVPVAIYTRVSTINQVGGRFDSCESQASICREFLRKHAAEGWYEAASFSDPAYSGGSMNRPGFQALKRQIEVGDIKIVLIFNSPSGKNAKCSQMETGNAWTLTMKKKNIQMTMG